MPVNYRHMAKAYPDLFVSASAAQMALLRENPQQTPIDNYLISVCGGFLSLRYRRGKRGPAATLLYDPERIDDPVAWLWQRIGKVIVLLASS